MLTRHEVLQRILDLYEGPAYLEIGVSMGTTFRGLKAPRKVGVDPRFLFEARNATTPAGTEEFHQIRSDVYFEAAGAAGIRFDVIYLDGLHTFEQTLRDLLSAVVLLKDKGTIVVDDTIPNSYDASLPDLAQVEMLRTMSKDVNAHWHADGSWMGDVFKIPFFVAAFMQQFSYATVAENHGQTEIWRSPRKAASIPPLTVEAVSRLDYRDTILNRPAFNIRPLGDIVRAMRP